MIKKNYKNYIASILASVLFFPLAFLGQICGNIFGEFFIWFNNYSSFLNIPKIISVVVIGYVSGYIAGYVSAFIIKKAYRNFNLKFALILPILVIAIAIIGDLSYAFKNGFDLEYLQHFVRNSLTIFYYYYFMNEFKIRD